MLQVDRFRRQNNSRHLSLAEKKEVRKKLCFADGRSKIGDLEKSLAKHAQQQNKRFPLELMSREVALLDSSSCVKKIFWLSEDKGLIELKGGEKLDFVIPFDL